MIDATSKTNRFLEAIEKYAEQQRSEMRAEVEAFREEQLAAANEEGTAAAFAMLRDQKQAIKAELAKETALKETQKKRELFEKRRKMSEEVFSAAEKRLLDFTKSNQYRDYLAASARLCAERLGGKAARVCIRREDEGFRELIGGLIPNGEITFDDAIRIGGIRCVCEELSIMIDDTLDTKLEDRKRLFVQTSGLIVE